MDSRRCFAFASLVIILSLSVIEFLPFLSAKSSNIPSFKLREKRFGTIQTTKEPDKTNFKWYDYVIVFAMLLISAGTGLYHAFAGGGQRTTSRFLMAERSMFSLPVAISVLASYLSAITVLGFPSEVFYHGIQYWMVALSYFFVIPVTALVFIPVFHGLGVTTAYEYLRKRFSPAVQYAGSLLFIIQTVFYMAIVLFAPAIALETVTKIPLYVTIISTGLLCTIYTALGGIKAVIWTDVFQFLVLFGSLMAVLIYGTVEAGGPSIVWNYNKNKSNLNFFVPNPDPTERLSFWSLTIGGAFNALPIWAVSQTAVQRFLTAKTLREAQKSIWYNLPGNIIMMTIVSLIGLVLFAYYKGQSPPDIKKNDQILISFVNHELPYLLGLFIACLFAGTLSTVASGLNALAAVTLIDIVKTYRQRNASARLPSAERVIDEDAARAQDYRDTILSKVLTFVFGILTVGLAFLAQKMGTLVQMANTVFGCIGGPLLGVFSLGVLYRRANSGGAIIGLIAGAYMGFWISIGALVHSDNGDVYPNAFWLYRISFMWYSTVATITTVLVGIVTSEIIRCAIPEERYREIDPLLLATFLRPKGWHRCVSATSSHDPRVVIGTQVIPNLYREVDVDEDDPLLSVEEYDSVQLQMSADHNFESNS